MGHEIVEIVGVFVPISFFIMIAAIVLVPRWFRNKEQSDIQKTLREAISRGVPLPDDLISSMSQLQEKRVNPNRDLRLGVLWLLSGFGIGAVGVLLGLVSSKVHDIDVDGVYAFSAFAALPVFIGVARILLWFIDSRSKR